MFFIIFNVSFLFPKGIRKNPTAPFVPRTVIIGGKVQAQTKQTQQHIWSPINRQRRGVTFVCLLNNESFSVALFRLLRGITWPRWSSGWSHQWPVWWITTPWWETSWRSSSWRTTECLWQRKVPFSQVPFTLPCHFTFGMLRKQCARCS